MAEVEMTHPFLHSLRIQGAAFFLSLLALSCLPWALTNLLRGVDLSLLLPITLFGVFIGLGLSTAYVKKISAGVILFGFGPLALGIYIGGIWPSLLKAVNITFAFTSGLFNAFSSHQPVDPSDLILAREELIQKSMGFGARFIQWLSGFLHGIQIEDPIIRTLIWCLVLWLVAAWGGWQMYRKNRLLVGMFPTTLLLALIIDFTGKEIKVLWLHLGLLLFLLGLTSFVEQQNRWEFLKTDYAKSTSINTLSAVVVLSITLTIFSSFASSVSVKDFIEKMREARAQLSSNKQGQALGLEPVQNNANINGIGTGLPRSHLITGGTDLSHQLVMTISTGELPPLPNIANMAVPHHYWRTLAYQVYNGTGWSNPTVFGSDVSPDENLVDEIPPGYRVLNQSVTFSSETMDRLYWAGTLQNVSVPFKAVWLRKAEHTPLLYSNMLAALASTESYQARSLILNVDVETLRESPAVYPEWVTRQFLNVPKTVPARVHGLARELTASASTPYDRALAIESYLRTFPYTLEVGAPPRGRDAADYFLFDLKKGYCDYYATTMVVLARAAGLPARLVVGYASGGYDFGGAQYIITENYAHSWVEVYFANIGWVEFEPTSNMPLIPYEEKNASTVPTAEPQLVERSFVENLAPLTQRVLTRVWIPVLILFVFGLLWVGYDSLRIARLDPSQMSQLLYWRFRRLAQPVTGTAPGSQTAHAYAIDLLQRLSFIKVPSRFQNWFVPAQHEIEQLTELFSRSLFSSIPPTRAEADDVLKSWSRLRWRLLAADLLAGIRRIK